MDYQVKNTISLTEARRRIFDLADKVQKPGTYFTFTEKGRAKAIMLSAEEFGAIIEAVETLDYFPDLKKDIEWGEKEIKQGDLYSLEEVMAEEGYVLADKFGKKEDVSRRSHKNRQKRSKKG